MKVKRIIQKKREFYESKLVEVEQGLIVNPKSNRLLKQKERFESQKMKCVKELRNILIDELLTED